MFREKSALREFSIALSILLSACGPSQDQTPGDNTGHHLDQGDLLSDILPDDNSLEELPADLQNMDFPDTQEISGLIATENPANIYSYYIEWKTAQPSPTQLTTRCDDAIEQSLSDEVLKLDHSVFVMGLHSDLSCSFTAEATALDDAPVDASIDVSLSSLTPDFLPPLTIETAENAALQEGWTLFNLTSIGENANEVIAIVDLEGRYRWYHRRANSEVPGGGFDVRTMEGGILSGGRRGAPPVAMISWEGLVFWEGPFSQHHDVRPSPFNDNHLLYLGDSREDCPENTSESTVNEFDLNTNTTVWTWFVCQHYTPQNVYPDWSHINTVAPVIGERTAILSPRNQDRLWKIDRDTDEIIWTLGEDGDFEMENDTIFYHQHAPEPQENGNILLFDNGHSPEREFSRAIELALSYDESGDPMAATLVWEYVDTEIFTPTRGDADRLPNGNTLVVFGDNSNGDSESYIVEASPDTQAEQLWRLTTPANWGIYRAERILSPSFGYILSN